MCECWAYQQCHVGIRCKGPSQKKKQEVSSSWKENSMIVCGISAKWEVELREAGTQAELRSSGICEPREWAELCHAGEGKSLEGFWQVGTSPGSVAWGDSLGWRVIWRRGEWPCRLGVPDCWWTLVTGRRWELDQGGGQETESRQWL